MLPLYSDSAFVFRFADERSIPRFHLEGVPQGQVVAVFALDPGTGARRARLTTATVGPEGWVDLSPPLHVKSGEGFVAVPVPTPTIRTETIADHDAIRQVNRRAFGREAEGRLVDALREGGYARLSLVAVVAEQIVGHIFFSVLPLLGEHEVLRAVALAPIAVLPEFQNLGIGSALVREGLRTCRAQGHPAVVVLGHPDFYPRFGFSADRARCLESPFTGEAFMALELIPGILGDANHRVEYPPPFSQIVD